MYDPKATETASEETQLQEEKRMKKSEEKCSHNHSSSKSPKQLKMPWHEAMKNLADDRLTADVKILIGKKVFEVHSCVLRTFCALFDSSLGSGSIVRLPEKKVSKAAFEVAYTWMITSDSNCPRGQLLDLLLAAEYMRAPKLKVSVFGALNNERLFSNLDALDCYIEASSKGLDEVMDLMLRRMGKAFLILIGTEEYRDLSIEDVCKFLSFDSLFVNSEIEVFYAALLWLLSDYEERHCHVRRILKTIRFELMPSMVLLNFGERLQELMPSTADQMSFLLQLAVINRQERARLPDPHDPPRNRAFIRDPECPYLEYLDAHADKLSATMFRDYIMMLQENFDDFLLRIAKEEKDKEEDNKDDKEDEDDVDMDTN